jgi:hypothetical protein
MRLGRRELLALAGIVVSSRIVMSEQKEAGQMFGLIGKLDAVAGQRDALITILLEGTTKMPGCLSYVVARDPADPNAIWITEVWDNEASTRPRCHCRPFVRPSRRASRLLRDSVSVPSRFRLVA